MRQLPRRLTNLGIALESIRLHTVKRLGYLGHGPSSYDARSRAHRRRISNVFHGSPEANKSRVENINEDDAPGIAF